MRWLAFVALVGCGAAWGEAGQVRARLAATLGGRFRCGLPVMLRVGLENDGPAFEGTLDVVVEGVTYRRPVRVGRGSGTWASVLAAVHSAGSRARVRVTDGGGGVLFDGALEAGLRAVDPTRGLVVAVEGAGALVEPLFGDACGTAEVAAGDLPTMSAAYLSADVVVVAGDGAALSVSAQRALGGWVRGGGVVAFVLAAEGPVRSGGLAAELAECSGRATVREWLGAVAEVQGTQDIGGGLVWGAGLGRVVAGPADGFARGALARLARPKARGRLGVDKGLYTAFPPPRMGGAVRWRLAAGSVALLAAGVVVVWLARGRGRVATVVAAAGGSVALAAVGWGLMLPRGRGVVAVGAVAEGAGHGGGGRRTELLAVGAVGEGRAEAWVGAAEAVVPVYYSREDVGSWTDVVVSCDEAGRWSVRCDLKGGVRHCFAAWWPAGDGEGPGRWPDGRTLLVRDGRYTVAAGAGTQAGEAWRSLRSLPSGWAAAGPLLLWQAKRVGKDGRAYRASWRRDGQARTRARRGLRGVGGCVTLVWEAAERP